jgi:hypothetical protein
MALVLVLGQLDVVSVLVQALGAALVLEAELELDQALEQEQEQEQALEPRSPTSRRPPVPQ